MEEYLKEKFEEKYKAWKDYKRFIESNDAELKQKQEDFTKRVQNLETKEQIEEYFQLQGEPSKHLYDTTVLGNSLYEVYKILKGKIEIPKEIEKEIQEIQQAKPYYIFKDSKLTKVNEEQHQNMQEAFYQNIQNLLKIEKH